MKNGNLGKIEEKLFKIFFIAIISILCLALIYGSIKYNYNYFTNNDEQICQNSNSTLINGQCHSEFNRTVKEQRDILLTLGIAFPILAILLMFYIWIILKIKFNEK